MRSLLDTFTGNEVRILTPGTTPYIGWARGTITVVTDEYVTLAQTGDEAKGRLVHIPLTAIDRLEVLR